MDSSKRDRSDQGNRLCHGSRKPCTSPALRVTFVYVVVSFLLILLLDLFFSTLPPGFARGVEHANVWLFVGLTGLILYLMLRNENRLRLNAEKRERAWQDRHRLLFENNGQVILVIDPMEGQILDANGSACRFYGYDRHELLERKISDINVLSYEEIRAEMAAAQKQERNYFRFRHRLAGGEIRDVEVHSYPVDIGGRTVLHSLVRDVTERRTAAAALAESEARYRTLAEYLPIAVLAHQNHEVVFANRAAAALFGASDPDALIGMPSIDFVADRDLPLANARVARVQETGIPNPVIELNFKRLDGSEFPAESQSIRISLHGEPVALAIIRDISDRKAAEEAIRIARDRAEAANRSKSHFLATVSHELRTPLTAIIGFSEMIAGSSGAPCDPGMTRDYGEQIHKSGNQLLSMVNDILEHSRYESGLAVLRPLYFDAGAFLNSLERLVIGQAAEKRVTLTVESTPAHFDIHADRQALRQGMLALINNAIKFTPKGGRITLAARWSGAGEVKLSVADTGIGIPADRLDKVLEPFVQVEEPYARRYGGVGLGLSRANLMASEHGGKLAIESSVRCGTTVTITLPQPVKVHPKYIDMDERDMELISA